MAEAAADAIALADDLGWDRFSLVGHSMSGVAIQHVLLTRRRTGCAAWSAWRPVPASGLPLGESRMGAVHLAPPPARQAAR